MTTNVNEVRQEVLRYFGNAMSQILQRGQNRGQIRQALEYCEHRMSQVGDPQADIYRLLAHSETADHVVSGALIEKMWEARGNWGDLILDAGHKELGYSHADMTQNHLQNWPFDLVVDYPWGIRMKVTTVADVLAAAAWQRIEAGQFESANSLLVNAPEVPIVAFVRAMLYYRARRWGQARDAAGSLVGATLLGPDDAPLVNQSGLMIPNVQLDMAGHLIAATALAHLDNLDAAAGALKKMVESKGEFVGVLAEACRIYGLVLRRQGNEEEALQIMNMGLGMASNKDLQAARDDRSISLTVTSEQLIEDRSSYWDASTEKSMESVLAADVEDDRRLRLKAAEEELHRQIGMEPVKKQVQALQHKIRFEQELIRRGKGREERSGHLVFTGPPGVGKTTIARIYAAMLYAYGVIRSPEVIEVSRDGLVAGYEGQTAPKTAAVIADAKARGAVLFIDEAYSLKQDRVGSEDSFGQEAVEVLLKEMEDGRSDLVVIIAGYEDKIKRFLASNEGLRSRFKKWIKFESYSIHELALIGRVMATNRGSIIPDDGIKALEEGLRNNLSDDIVGGLSMIDRAGNARFVRNIIETAEEFREERLAGAELSALSDEDLLTFEAADITQAVVSMCEQMR